MFTCPDIHPTTCALSSGKSLPPPRVRTHGTEDGLHQGRPSGRRTRSTLPVGHVGAHPGSLRASGGQQGSSHLGAQLTSADFRSTGMPSPTSGSAHGPQPEVECETDASLPEDVVSQAGDEVPHTSGLGLPLGELLALPNEHLPQAFTQEAATTQQPSFFRTLQAAQQPESGALKVSTPPGVFRSRQSHTRVPGQHPFEPQRIGPLDLPFRPEASELPADGPAHTVGYLSSQRSTPRATYDPTGQLGLDLRYHRQIYAEATLRGVKHTERCPLLSGLGNTPRHHRIGFSASPLCLALWTSATTPIPHRCGRCFRL